MPVRPVDIPGALATRRDGEDYEPEVSPGRDKVGYDLRDIDAGQHRNSIIRNVAFGGRHYRLLVYFLSVEEMCDCEMDVLDARTS